jgi:hypothetical protein
MYHQPFASRDQPPADREYHALLGKVCVFEKTASFQENAHHSCRFLHAIVEKLTADGSLVVRAFRGIRGFRKSWNHEKH